MKRPATWALILLLVLTLGSPALGTDVVIRGASAWQEAAIRDVLSWEELPPLQRHIEIQVAAGNFGGCTGITITPTTSRDYLEYVLLHEYGHVWDCQQLSLEDRSFLLDCLDWDCLTLHDDRTWRDRNLNHNARPVEQFADMFAKIVRENHYSGSEYITWSTFPEPLIFRMIRFRTNFPNR